MMNKIPDFDHWSHSLRLEGIMEFHKGNWAAVEKLLASKLQEAFTLGVNHNECRREKKTGEEEA